MQDSFNGSAEGGSSVSLQQLQYALFTRGISKTIIAPLDRIKFLLQCDGELVRLGKMENRFGGALNCLQRVVGLEGVASLWRGNMIHVASIIPSTLSQVFLGLPVQKVVFEALPNSTIFSYTVATFLSGIAAAAATSIITYPFDFVRFRLTCDVRVHVSMPYDYRHSLAVLSHPAIGDQPTLLYRGLSLYIAGSFLYRALFLTTLQLAAPYLPTDEAAELSYRAFLTQMISAYAMVTFSTLWLYPVDTVRRRMMLSVCQDYLQYPTVMSCVRFILKKEGVGGLYRGAGFTAFRTAVTTSFTLLGLSI